MMEGRLAEARRDFDTAIRLDANSVDAYLRRAMVSMKQGDLDGAASDVETALAIEPNAPTSLFVRANLRRRRGDASGARADIEQALAVAPRDWPQRAEAEQLLQSLATSSPRP